MPAPPRARRTSPGFAAPCAIARTFAARCDPHVRAIGTTSETVPVAPTLTAPTGTTSETVPVARR